MVKKEKLYYDIEKLKRICFHYYKKNNFNRALDMIQVLGNYLYQTNQIYVDFDLENLINTISQQLAFEIQIENGMKEKKILFYDGFGIERRGLSLIYIEALISCGYEIVYAIPARSVKNLSKTEEKIKKSGGTICYIPKLSKVKSIEYLVGLVNEEKVSKILLYIQPNDVVPLTVSAILNGKVERFLINLTDHAFWLGASLLDYCIEFRDYGARISLVERKITKEKIIKIPYYPQINKDISFQGFPFEKGEKKVMFSGGALYKTFGAGNKYYLLVDKILNKIPDLLFLYAGSGNQSELKKLEEKYRNRVYWMQERNDLYQIMRNSDIYLSTYPMAGGLMTQYAVAAKRIPVTLLYDECGSGFILHPEKLKFEFDNMEDIVSFLDEFFSSENYKKECEYHLEDQLIEKNEFNKQVQKCLSQHSSDYEIQFGKIQTNNFRKTYLERLNLANYLLMWFDINNCILLRWFPFKFVAGLIIRIVKKYLISRIK